MSFFYLRAVCVTVGTDVLCCEVRIHLLTLLGVGNNIHSTIRTKSNFICICARYTRQAWMLKCGVSSSVRAYVRCTFCPGVRFLPTHARTRPGTRHMDAARIHVLTAGGPQALGWIPTYVCNVEQQRVRVNYSGQRGIWGYPRTLVLRRKRGTSFLLHAILGGYWPSCLLVPAVV